MADLGQAGARFQCAATVSLPEGQLTVQGPATLTETGNQPFMLAITGGTGAYRTARGRPRSPRSAKPNSTTPSPSSGKRRRLSAGQGDAQRGVPAWLATTLSLFRPDWLWQA